MDGIFKNDWSRTKGHPSEDELLLFVDGELTPKATSHLREHLDACWSCRVSTEKIEQTISTFIDYRNQLLKPLIEQPPHGWQGFDGKLNRLAVEIGEPSLLANVRGTLSRLLFAPNFLINLRILLRPVSVAVVLLLIGFLFVRFNRTPPVSAGELLTRAAEAQQRRIVATDQAVIYQKLRVRQRSATVETITWELWNDTVNLRSRQSVELAGLRKVVEDKTTPASLSLLTNILRANHMNPSMPLSASSFDSWRRSVNASDEVVETKLDDGQAAFVLKSSARHVNPGEIIEARLVIRSSDWHPVEEHLRVKGSPNDVEFELSETAYAVVGLSTLAPEVFAENPVATANRNRAETKASVSNAISSSPTVATVELEVEVLRLLHEARADLGEQISATRETDGLLHVKGLVDTAERKSEILRALKPIATRAEVRIEIQTLSEAIAEQQKQTARPKASPTQVTEADVDSGDETIAAAPELRRHFGSSEEIQKFSARIVSLSRNSMRHVYAMKRLVAQLTPEELRTLSPEARHKWLALIRSHARDYQNDATTMQRELRAVFAPTSSASSASNLQIKDDAALVRAVEQLFNFASANDATIRSAFTTSAGSTALPGISSPQFWQSLNDAQVLASKIEAAQP